MQLDELSHDREPQAKTARALGCARFGLAKALEHQREEVRANPHAVVRHSDLDVRVPALQMDRDASALRRELDGVREQIPYALLKARRVSDRQGNGGVERAFD